MLIGALNCDSNYDLSYDMIMLTGVNTQVNSAY